MAVNRQDRKLLEWTKHPSWPMKAYETGLPSEERLKYKFLLSQVQEYGHRFDLSTATEEQMMTTPRCSLEWQPQLSI